MRRSSLAIVLLLAAAACSSTEEKGRVASGKKKATTTTEVAAAPADAATDPAAATPEAAAGKAGTSSRRATASGSAAAKPGSAAARAAAAGLPDLGPPSQGVTATEIKIGFWIINTDTGCQAIGGTRGPGQGCNSADRQSVEAYVKHINANGGIAGRNIVPVIYETEATRGTWASQAQAACTHFTDDQKVFAAVSEGEVGRDIMAYCLANKNIPVIDPGQHPFDDKAYAELKQLLYQPDRARPERWIRAYVDGLADQGFFSGGSKIGLIRFDGAAWDRATAILKARLGDRNLRVAEEAAIATPPSIAGYGDMNSQLSSAVLRFRNSGVDRVVFLASYELSLFVFNQAEAANYRPRYGVSSLQYLARVSGDAPDVQMRNSVGVAWLPRFDVTAENDPGGNQLVELCKRLITSAGQNAGAGRNSRCSGVFFLKAALDNARALNPAGLREAVEGLGDSFQPGETFTARFGPGRHDGPSTMRYIAFADDCGCFKYVGGPRPLP